ncbi:selenoprotein H [Heracleum sosnowskyi]|uniref:Selenoprotein H n=1 Tax=Heracleum sosnowskyi TaxID=360622 RepID=A0AAD8HPV0_9APIA|nr:selenoprotein H [Heracleum sosnowskyi]
MAPKKRGRSSNDENPAAPISIASKRVTRSSTSSSSKTSTTAPPSAKKKPKTAVVEKPSKPPASKTVVIEHCKQCHQFKTRAIKVKDALENDISGINVLVNPEKPRRGCFEVREEGGEIFISLLDMKRPFQPMRALDMDQVISDILDKLK